MEAKVNEDEKNSQILKRDIVELELAPDVEEVKKK